VNEPRQLVIQRELANLLKGVRQENGYATTAKRVILKYVKHPDTEDYVLMVLRGGWTSQWADETGDELIRTTVVYGIVCHYQAEADDDDDSKLNTAGTRIEQDLKTALEIGQRAFMTVADAESLHVESAEPLTSVDAVKSTFQMNVVVVYLEDKGEQLQT